MDDKHTRFARLRRQARVSQWELSRLGNVSRYNISLFESGYRALELAEFEKLERILKDLCATQGEVK